MATPSRPCFSFFLLWRGEARHAHAHAHALWVGGRPQLSVFFSFFFARSVGGLPMPPGSPMPMPMPVRPRVAARGYLPLPSSFLLEEGGRSRLVATPFCPPILSFFCVRGGAGLPMFMRSKFGLVATPPCPLFFSCLKERGWGVLSIPYAHAHGHARCCALPCLLYCPWAHAHAPCPCPCPCALGWWPPPSCPLFPLKGEVFFWKEGAC